MVRVCVCGYMCSCFWTRCTSAFAFMCASKLKDACIYAYIYIYIHVMYVYIYIWDICVHMHVYINMYMVVDQYSRARKTPSSREKQYTQLHIFHVCMHDMYAYACPCCPPPTRGLAGVKRTPTRAGNAFQQGSLNQLPSMPGG